jgi:hypothetical protein
MLDLNVNGDSAVTNELRIDDGVDWRGIEPEMAIVHQEAPKVFARHGFYCWVTSAVRDDPNSLHGYGLALDFDASVPVTEEEGLRMASELRANLGKQFQVLWHKTPRGNFHLHVEFDFDGKGVEHYKR